jgi:hypothetical protein
MIKAKVKKIIKREYFQSMALPPGCSFLGMNPAPGVPGPDLREGWI